MSDPRNFEVERLIRLNGTRYVIPWGIRTGQWLFNNLPHECRIIVGDSAFDPFFVDLSEWGLQDWCDNHLIFNEKGEVIGLFNRNLLLWEKK